MAAPGPVCSDAERRYAVWAHDDLRARGHEAWVETVWIRPQLAAGVALGCVVAAVGGLLALASPVAGVAMAALGALSLLVDAVGRAGPLRWLFPRRATQVVLVAAATRASATQVVLVAADAASAVDVLLVVRTDVPRGGLARRFDGVPGGLWWLAVAAVGVVAAAAARVGGADGTLLGAAQLLPTVVLLVAATVALDSLMTAGGAGAEVAEAVAAALAAHDALVRDPAPGVAAGLVLGPPAAVRVHLRAERLDPRRTALLVVRAGPVRTRHHQWRTAAQAVGVAVRGGGPRGLPAVEAPPALAEPLSRALGGVVSEG
jgi:hypothetical protein